MRELPAERCVVAFENSACWNSSKPTDRISLVVRDRLSEYQLRTVNDVSRMQDSSLNRFFRSGLKLKTPLKRTTSTEASERDRFWSRPPRT